MAGATVASAAAKAVVAAMVATVVGLVASRAVKEMVERVEGEEALVGVPAAKTGFDRLNVKAAFIEASQKQGLKGRQFDSCQALTGSGGADGGGEAGGCG